MTTAATLSLSKVQGAHSMTVGILPCLSTRAHASGDVQLLSALCLKQKKSICKASTSLHPTGVSVPWGDNRGCGRWELGTTLVR